LLGCALGAGSPAKVLCTMQQRVLLGAGIAVVAVAAFLFFRAGTDHVATQAVDKNIDQIVATLPPGYAVSHGATDANPLTGTVTLHDFQVNYGGKLLWSADTLTISGADQHALSDVFDPAAYPNGHPAWTQRRLLVGDATANGVHILAHDNSGESLFIKSITLHQLSGRPFMLPPTHEHLHEAAMRADIALAFAFQNAEQHDVVVSDAPPRHGKVTMADVNLRDYDGGKIGNASLRDMSLDINASQPGQAITHGTLDSIEIRNADGTAGLEHQRDSSTVDTSIYGKMSYEFVEMRGMTVNISPGPRISLQDMQFKYPLAAANGERDGQGALTNLTVALKDTKLSPDAAAAIQAFGMNAVTMDLTVKSHGNETDKHASVTEDLVMHDLATLHLDADITGYDQGVGQHNPKAALESTVLNHAAISLQDHGLVDRIFNAVASRMHTTPAIIRAQLAVPLVTLGLMIPDQPDATDQISAFLNHPGTLSVAMTPPANTTIADIEHAPMQAKAHVLGVKIQAR
jgi:hypothetical protein